MAIVVGVIVGTKDYSTVNDRYYTSVGEPISLVSYSQLKFNLAEAAARGWINASAETYYYDGIKLNTFLTLYCIHQIIAECLFKI